MPGNPFGNRSLFDLRGRSAIVVVAAPKRIPKSRDRTSDSREHIGRVKELSCACCEAAGPSIAHHIREGQGGQQRGPDWLAIPLCDPCHVGRHGVHGDKSRMAIRKLTELDMLSDTFQKLLS